MEPNPLPSLPPHEVARRLLEVDFLGAIDLEAPCLAGKVGGRVGDYVLERVLGSGAFGTVFLARGSARRVALKLASERVAFDERRRARFLREGQIAAALRHSGLVVVLSAGIEEGRPYLVFEWVEGARTLDVHFEGLGLSAKVRGLRDIARAVGHAHRHGVVHRDLKPNNILVDPTGRLRVTDFGVANLASLERLTQTREMVGTPLYMAPETLREGSKTSAPTVDVWALGVILYEALTGVHPYHREGALAAELFARLSRGALSTPPRQVAPAIPARLSKICVRALAPSARDRYPDGNALAKALDDWLKHEHDSEPLEGRHSLTSTRRGVHRRAWSFGVCAGLLAGCLALAISVRRGAANQRSLGRRGTRSAGAPAPAPAPAPEGTSKGSSRMLLRVRASEAFGSRQGGAGWLYLAPRGRLRYDAERRRWRDQSSQAYLNAGGGAPSVRQPVVRRYTAPRAGIARIHGVAQRLEPGGDGVTVGIWVDGIPLWSVILESVAPEPFDFEVPVRVGSTVDLFLSRGPQTDDHDATAFDPWIEIRPANGGAGVARASVRRRASTVFGQRQGQHGWSYLGPNGPLRYDPGQRCWVGREPYARITAGGGIPGTIGFVTRRFTAPYAGTARARGAARCPDPRSDGVDVEVRLDGNVLWSARLRDTNSAAFDLTFEVEQGGRIDFVLRRGPRTNSFDATQLDPDVSLRERR